MADLTTEVNSPSYKNAAWLRQQSALTIVRDLSGGTPRLRAQNQVYLPKEPGEGTEAYQVRLARSLLFNTFVKVREGLIGMALKPRARKPAVPAVDGSPTPTPTTKPSDIGLEADVPAIIKQHCEDIDLAGNHLDVFAKELFRDVVNDGHALILVDMQLALRMSITSAASIPDASDELAAGRRPYWVKYRKDQACNARSARLNGVEVITQISLEECATEPDGEYGEREVKRYRVLRLPLIALKTPTREAVYGPMVWELYERQVVSGQEVDVLIVGGQTDLARIPIVVVYARRKGLLESDPPLLDLAYLNIGHWQQWSDLNCQQRMLVPVLHIKGEILNAPEAVEGAQKPQLKLGPGVAIQTDKDGDVNYKAADPSATDAIRNSLLDLEQRMSAVGLSIIAAKEDKQVTATEKILDQNERESELSSWVRALKDGLEAALQLHAGYLGLPDGGSIALGFDETDAQPEAVQAIDAPKGTLPPASMPAPASSMVQ